jgi:butyrate kinase
MLSGKLFVFVQHIVTRGIKAKIVEPPDKLNKNIVLFTRQGLTPILTGRLTVSHNMALTLTYKVCVKAASNISAIVLQVIGSDKK